jgi:hypothetical protein
MRDTEGLIRGEGRQNFPAVIDKEQGLFSIRVATGAIEIAGFDAKGGCINNPVCYDPVDSAE